ncbi:SDR family NAD(P)-dependent oxidoreductase [Streptomyces sp. NPDC096153]|uniref:SDR family NAD(P)-dependent oxidoreductase n=1 Tax=Streptomyces sp. NPDC096153 TaxID=3155548 RepID=UPI00332EB36F
MGLAIAAAGANVVLTSRSQEAADAAAAQVKGTAVGVGAHAVDEEAARRCTELTLDRFGSLDILVNNAGTSPAFGPVIDQDHGRFAKTFDVNLWAPVPWTSLATRAWMGEHGGAAAERWGTRYSREGKTAWTEQSLAGTFARPSQAYCRIRQRSPRRDARHGDSQRCRINRVGPLRG